MVLVEELGDGPVGCRGSGPLDAVGCNSSGDEIRSKSSIDAEQVEVVRTSPVP